MKYCAPPVYKAPKMTNAFVRMKSQSFGGIDLSSSSDSNDCAITSPANANAPPVAMCFNMRGLNCIDLIALLNRDAISTVDRTGTVHFLDMRMSLPNHPLCR